MAILSVNDYMSAGKEDLLITKTATRTSFAAGELDFNID